MATTSQVVTSALPTAFEEFYKTGVAQVGKPGEVGYKPGVPGLIPQAFQLYGAGTPEDYQKNIKGVLEAGNLYTGAQRVEGLTADQASVGTELRGMETPGQFASGTSALASGVTALSGLPSMLTPGVMTQYMSPYTQGVVDIAKQKAIEDAQKTQLMQNLGAARQGAYGGSRQLLAGTERERALGQNLSDIQTKGLQAAYEAGQKGLESERAARLQQAQTYGTLGQQYGQLGVAQQAADLDRLKTLGAYGDYERAIEQQKTDVDYANLLDRIRYPETQLEKTSNFIRGVPMTDTTTQTTTPPPSFASQLAGMGMAGLSLYNLMK
jgi:hypothetical protein